MIELVDTADASCAFLPALDGMTNVGLVTLVEINVLHHGKSAVSAGG